jgi:AraC-like DNA-binding protein
LQEGGLFLYLSRMKTWLAWWDSVAEPAQWLDLFDNLPNVYFYAKDLQHRFMRVNQATCELHGCRSPADMIGRRDEDFHTPTLAAQYVEEDREVFASGVPLRDKVWLVRDAEGLPRWFVSSKFPLFDRGGRTVGLAGVMRAHDGTGSDGRDAHARLTPALEHVLHRYGEPLSVEALAALCHLSVSQLQREFRRCFECTPTEYLLGVRLLMARSRLQSTGDPVGVIALECGFYDQSHFTRAFQRANGISPSAFRKTAERVAFT